METERSPTDIHVLHIEAILPSLQVGIEAHPHDDERREGERDERCCLGSRVDVGLDSAIDQAFRAVKEISGGSM